MTLQEDFDPKNVRKVGVYVFSEGKQRSAVRNSVWSTQDALDVFENIIAIPIILVSAGGLGVRGYMMNVNKFDQSHYPPRVTRTAEFEPDTANAGPSLELSVKIQKELEERGYKAEVFTDLGHSEDITVKDCLAHARENKMDAAFVVCYRGITSWRKYTGSYISGDTRVLQYKLWKGFLYLPNAGFFNAETEEMIWSNNYYGIVEEAHVMNFADEEFTQVIPEAIIENGGETYFEAAPPALEMIFSPKYWPGSQKPFPSRREKGAGGSF